ncbi:hypothetical protein HK104_011166 [Borealophlyctis nickersoniae]|nr:hypothetical protein HK104_011166 [Borealophlyctis nickersoniae]
MHLTTLLATTALLLTGSTITTASPTSSSSLQARAPAISFPKHASANAKPFSSVYVIKAGQVFDGKMMRYRRSQKNACKGQKEGGDKDALFLLEKGATLKNAIIGANQAEGVHCKDGCTIHNVWFEDVCEDAITLRGSSPSFITSSGARNAEDKIIQHNGSGPVTIRDFFAENFGKLYRSCGTCGGIKRNVVIDGVRAKNGLVVAGINANNGDTATLRNIQVSGVKGVCDKFQASGKKEPKKVGTGADGKNCLFTSRDVRSF